MQKERKFAKKDTPEFEETAAETDAVKFASGKQNPKKQKRTRRGGKKKNKKKYTDKMNPFPSSSESCLSAEELVCLEDSSLSNGKEETVLLNCSVEKNAENTKDLKPLSDSSGEEVSMKIHVVLPHAVKFCHPRKHLKKGHSILVENRLTMKEICVNFSHQFIHMRQRKKPMVTGKVNL